ncbi:hypothetical protein H0H93_001709 [Arthromyces matolae]|nr:hypothetical protein H0H93_001709 [Arthromyces matolae]
MSMLPKGGTIQYKRDDDIENGDTSRRISHLVTLTRGLLPADDAPITLSSRVRSFINSDHEEDEEDSFYRMPKTPKLSLRQLRLSNINADAHNHTWNENGGIPPHKFCVGDIGYIPEEGKNFSDFVILGNVLKEGLVKFKLREHAYGTQWSWKDVPIRRAPLEPFSLSEHATGWSMVVLPFAKVDCQITHSTFLESVADAWHFLLQHGKAIAMKHKVKPEELILITHAGTDQDFSIHDFDSQPPLARRPNQVFVRQPSHIPRPFGFSGIQQMNPVFPTNQPAIMYLITSSKPGFAPYWSHHPVIVSGGAARPVLNRGWVHRIGW